LSEIIKKYPQIAVISDEVYRIQNYSNEVYTYDSIAKYLPDQTILVGGMSKEVSGTGLRLGFAAGPSHVIKAMAVLNAHTISCLNYVTQMGFAKFLQHDCQLTDRLAIRTTLNERRKLIHHLFETLPALRHCPLGSPQGAFYIFPNISYYLTKTTKQGHRIQTDTDLALYLLNHAKVVVLPGSSFSRPGHLRLAYAAVDEETITKGLGLVNLWLTELGI